MVVVGVGRDDEAAGEGGHGDGLQGRQRVGARKRHRGGGSGMLRGGLAWFAPDPVVAYDVAAPIGWMPGAFRLASRGGRSAGDCQMPSAVHGVVLVLLRDEQETP